MSSPITFQFRGRSFDRLVNFSDAIVAVAITVLVLPIADLAISRAEKTVWQVLSDNSGQVITFFFTFAVVGIMWSIHNKIFNQLFAFDTAIFWLNLAWLASIAFLPVTSNLYGTADIQGNHGWSGGVDLGGSGLLYWGSLALVSFWGTLIAWHVRRHPELIDPDLGPPSLSVTTWRTRFRGAIYTGYFALIGLVSLISPVAAAYLPFGLIFLGRLLR